MSNYSVKCVTSGKKTIFTGKKDGLVSVYIEEASIGGKWTGEGVCLNKVTLAPCLMCM